VSHKSETELCPWRSDVVTWNKWSHFFERCFCAYRTKYQRNPGANLTVVDLYV